MFRWRELLLSVRDRERFALISGAGRLSDLALQLGFDAIMEGLHNLVPHQAVELYRLAKAGDYRRAALLQEAINRCFRIVEVDGPWRGVSLALRYMGICDNIAAHPYDFQLAPEARAEIVRCADELGLARPYPSRLAAYEREVTASVSSNG